MSLVSGNQCAPAEPSVTLFVPGLLAGTSAPTSLTRLLTRADRLNGGLERTAQLFALFGIASEPDCDLPVAAVTRIADMGIIDNDWWIRADPVYLEARRDSLVLFDGIGLDQSETDRLVAELDESLMLDGWLLKAPTPERWYLKPLSAPAITTTPPGEAVGRDIHALLPQGPDRPAWHSRLTELQILLHTSAVNAEREARGALPANSVWFWGGGRLPRAASSPWRVVFAQDPLSLGLARLTGSTAVPLPAGSGVELAQSHRQGDVLVVLESLLTASPGAMDQFCHLWLAPLIAAVHRADIGALTLVTDRGPRFRYTRVHRWRVWRRGRAPSAWREQAA